MISLSDIRRLPTAGFANLNFRSVTGVSTDSRSVSGGQIFFALKGENFDGHNFVAEAIRKGAACAVVDRKWQAEHADEGGRLPLVAVDDTSVALGQLARIYREKFDIPVIAVGGSNGKTTTKEMVSRVLAKRLRVLKTEGNHNNQIGVPLTVLRLSRRHQIAVLEIGTNHPGEIGRLCEVLDPSAGLITNIGSEHLEYFGNTSGVMKEEGSLFDYLSKSRGLAFVNADDGDVVRLSRKTGKRFVFGFSAKYSRKDVSGKLFGLDARGRAVFEIRYRGRTELVRLRVPGIHNASNALAAAAVGFRYGVAPHEIREALESYGSFDKRMELLKVRGVTILNDTYNSNPDSALAALGWLSAVKSKGKKIVTLGDMLELGSSSVSEHRRVGSAIAKSKFDYLFTFGPMASQIAAAADGRLVTESFEDKQALSRRLAGMVEKGDVVLVKGSRGMKMEEVVKELVDAIETRKDC